LTFCAGGSLQTALSTEAKTSSAVTNLNYVISTAPTLVSCPDECIFFNMILDEQI